jgi:hypothetical protein
MRAFAASEARLTGIHGLTKFTDVVKRDAQG